MNTESPVFPNQVNLKPHARFRTYHFRKREREEFDNYKRLVDFLLMILNYFYVIFILHSSLIYGIFIVIAIFIRLFL